MGCLLLASLAPISDRLLAQERHFEFSLQTAPGVSYSNLDGYDFDLGLGLGVGWSLSDIWTVEARGMFTNGDRRFSDSSVDVFQLGLRRSYQTGSSWHPFFSFGAHYQHEEVDYQVVCVRAPCPRQRDRGSSYGGFAGGGVDWQFADWAALRFEGRAALYDSHLSDGTESSFLGTVGVVFHP